jgi:CP family cyanate transporter-like MFS transporter
MIINAGVSCAALGLLAIRSHLPANNNYQTVFYIYSYIHSHSFIVDHYRDTPQSASKRAGRNKYSRLKQLLKNKNIMAVAFLLFLHNFVFYTWSGWLPIYLLERGVSVDSAGLMTSIMLWVGVPTILIPLLSLGSNVRANCLSGLPVLFIF